MLKLPLHWRILIGIFIGAALGTALNVAYYPDIAVQARWLARIRPDHLVPFRGEEQARAAGFKPSSKASAVP